MSERDQNFIGKARLKLLDNSFAPALRESEPVRSRLVAASHNTGNLLFLAALRQQFPSAQLVPEWMDLVSDCDIIVLSMANFINPYTDVAAEAETLERCAAQKIILIGCGAQASRYDDWFDLRPDTARFLRVVSERSASIGVRGHYTAELLRRHGFANTRVIGCPAFYMSGRCPPVPRAVPTPRRIAIGATPTGDQRALIRRLYSFAVRNDAAYVLQSEEHLLGLFDHTPENDKDLEFFVHYYLPHVGSPEDFARWLGQRAKFFFDIDQWFDHLRSFDLYIGTRIHGSVAALQAGCPALTLVHDTRTRELCEQFHLPCLELAEFDAEAAPEHYLRLARYHNFRACYPLRLAEYVAFMQENGIAPSGLTGEQPSEVVVGGNHHTTTHDLNDHQIGKATRIRLAKQILHDVLHAPALSTDEVNLPLGSDPGVGDQSASPSEEHVLAKRKDLADALAAFTRSTGCDPEFILGHDAPIHEIPLEKLASCRVLNDRNEIIRQMSDRGAVAEIGTQTGVFANFILNTCPNVKLFTIDIDYSPFRFDTLQRFIDNNRLEVITGQSWEELARFPEGFFSWVYIDASHFIDHIRRDLAAAKTRVEIGGHVVCNDYTIWSPFEAQPYGVLPAVNEFLANEDFYVSYFAFHPFGYHDIALCRRS